MRRLLINFITIFVNISIVFANNISVEARIDSSSIVIGDQTAMKIRISKPTTATLLYPAFKDTITQDIEIIHPIKIDTIKHNNGNEELIFTLLLTSFEPGEYIIPPVVFSDNINKYSSLPIPLSIRPFVLDDEELSDIKPIMTVPFDWKSFFMWFGLVLIILALVALIVYILVKYVFKKNLPIINETKSIYIPPHIIALQKLDNIKNDKIWQKGKTKDYYSQLSEVLREYLEQRFDIPALEMTTDEIIDILINFSEIKEVKPLLQEILRLSDLVKFAKHVPLPSENELSLVNSYFFVDKTKIEPNIEDNSTKTE